MESARRAISDFSLIKTSADTMYTPDDCAARFSTSFSYLKKELASCDADRTVVVTHFPPGLSTLNPRFRVDPLSAYFNANVSVLLEEYQPALWIYGHNHYSSDQKLNRTRVISNQLGYPSEEGMIPSYDPAMLVRLEVGGHAL